MDKDTINEKFQINNVVKIIKYPDQPHWFNEKTGYKLGSLYIVTKQKSAYYGNIYMYELSSVGGSPIGGMPEDCMEFCYDVCAENNNKELIYEVW